MPRHRHYRRKDQLPQLDPAEQVARQRAHFQQQYARAVETVAAGHPLTFDLDTVLRFTYRSREQFDADVAALRYRQSLCPHGGPVFHTNPPGA